MVELGDQVAASGRHPTPERQVTMERLGATLEKHGKFDLLPLFLAVAALSTATYW